MLKVRSFFGSRGSARVHGAVEAFNPGMLVVRLCSQSNLSRAFRLSKSCAGFVWKNTDLPVSGAWTRGRFKHRSKRLRSDADPVQEPCEIRQAFISGSRAEKIEVELLLRPTSASTPAVLCSALNVPNDVIAGKAVNFAAGCVTTREVRPGTSPPFTSSTGVLRSSASSIRDTCPTTGLLSTPSSS